MLLVTIVDTIRGTVLQVYVLGCSVTVANRPSLQIPPEEDDVKAQRKGIQTVSRVSAHNSTSPMGCHRVRPPPAWLLDQLAAELRQRLNLQMFNFDLIRPTRRDSPGELTLATTSPPGFPTSPVECHEILTRCSSS